MKATYKHLFQILKYKVKEIFKKDLSPKYISVDYESAAIGAVRDEFPDSFIAGCFFHLAQSFWRHLQSEGLFTEYCEKENDEMRSQFHSLIALTFVPEDDVPEAFDEL